MSEQTKIQWADSTLNFWEGCTKVSDGCKNCYAEARDKRFTGGTLWGKGAPRRKSKSAVKDALAYNRKPFVCGNGHAGSSTTFCYEDGCESTDFHRRRIFSLSLGDWLDPEVPIEWLAEMLDTIRQCDQVTWILCTKRPELFERRTHEAIKLVENNDCKWNDGISALGYRNWLADWQLLRKAPRNIILLASVENQNAADERIPALLKIPAACRGLSLEPLLGPVKIDNWLEPANLGGTVKSLIDWAIIGGESGANARTCNVEWIQSLVQQSKAAGVATFVKQLGSNPTCRNNEDCVLTLKDKKGADPSEWPEDLRVQKWPKGF